MNHRITGVTPLRWFHHLPVGPILSRAGRLLPVPRRTPPADLVVTKEEVNSHVHVRFIRPRNRTGPLPLLLWMHGGGHVGGAPEQDDRALMAFAQELGIAVAAVRYRIGIEAPSPTSVTDCYDALTAIVNRAEELGLDPDRVAIGGASAGGGVAAALALYARDHGGPVLRLQLLIAPMLDDRTALREDLDHARLWTPKHNRFGWETYLRREPGSEDVTPYEAPARATALAELPSTWIGVGTEDLFFDEDTLFARQLKEAGVETEYVLVECGYHGFEALAPDSRAARQFWDAQANALRAALLDDAEHTRAPARDR
ncbi:alpha/beta hydrolase [Leucobacter sp. CSA2]|uniref:Alpha/beta hydrolase n=1 Tax=Leucobacter edaphi TaxID=2796472 RepID=A0A934QB34_9MICO|nr:alpha/beta hydrolase [Leucobacter edaphi]MBK0420610.1 alpha/beta hydrolase [Leucobacter edaphi]